MVESGVHRVVEAFGSERKSAGSQVYVVLGAPETLSSMLLPGQMATTGSVEMILGAKHTVWLLNDPPVLPVNPQ